MLKKGYKTGLFINTTTVLPPSGLAGESQGSLLEAMRSSFDRSAVPKAAEMARPSYNSGQYRSKSRPRWEAVAFAFDQLNAGAFTKQYMV